MTSILLCTLFVVVQADDKPLPLTPTQITNLQQLVRRTQDRDAKLKAALEDGQQKLMKAYSQFELDEDRITELHKEIIRLQRELLENYRDLQVQLRSAVGETRFLHMKKRIDLILKAKKKVQVGPGKTPSEAPTPERRSISQGSRLP